MVINYLLTGMILQVGPHLSLDDFMLVHTPRKINMAHLRIHPSKKENHLPIHHFTGAMAVSFRAGKRVNLVFFWGGVVGGTSQNLRPGTRLKFSLWL